MTAISADDVRIGALLSLGIFDEELKASSAELISESLRHVASLRAPLSKRRLRRAVFESLRPITADPEALSDLIADQLDLLLANGDLEEVKTTEEGDLKTLLYLAPPAFVEHGDTILLLGVRPDAEPLIGEIGADEVGHLGHLRLMQPKDLDVTKTVLNDFGLAMLPLETWLRQPAATNPRTLLEDVRSRLDAAIHVPAGVADISLIDPSAPTSYYRGRWRLPDQADNGVFVGRRRREYGADAWCALEVIAGVVTKSIELPNRAGIELAHDEAWLIQLAIDAEGGKPQSFRTVQGANADISTLDLFGPVPSWAQRRLSVFGKPINKTRGALMSFEVATSDLPDLSEFFTGHLWMHEESGQ